MMYATHKKTDKKIMYYNEEVLLIGSQFLIVNSTHHKYMTLSNTN